MSTDSSPPDGVRCVDRLVGVYDADGGLAGELRYVVGHLLGRAECALCDITHGPLRRKAAFDELRERLGVPFLVVHRNEPGSEATAMPPTDLPYVAAEVGARRELLLDRTALVGCRGDVAAFERALRAALSAHRLVLPER